MGREGHNRWSRLILEIWRRLGLTAEEGADRTWALWVDEPLR